MTKVVDGEPTDMTEPVPFDVVPLNNATLGTDDREALVAFQVEASELMAEVRTAAQQLDEAEERLANIKTAVHATPSLPDSLLADARTLERRIADLQVELEGDPSVARRQFETPPSIGDRAGFVLYSSYGATSAPTGQQREQLRIAEEDFGEIRPAVDRLLEDVTALEDRVQELGGPYLRGQDR